MTAEPTTSEIQALIEAHLPLVRQVLASVAGHFPRHTDRDELAQAATLGLVEAAHRFDAERGRPFRALGCPAHPRRHPGCRPRARLRSAYPPCGHAGRRRSPPRARGRAAPDPHRPRAGRPDGRVAARADLARGPRAPGPGDQPRRRHRPDRGRAAHVWRARSSTRSSPTRSACSRTWSGRATSGMPSMSLPDRQRDVVVSYFLDGEASGSIAARLGVTESRVSQMRSEALAKLRAALTSVYAEEPARGLQPRPGLRRSGGRPFELCLAGQPQPRRGRLTGGPDAPAESFRKTDGLHADLHHRPDAGAQCTQGARCTHFCNARRCGR